MNIRPQVSASCVLIALFVGRGVLAASVNDFVDFSEPTLPGRLYVPPEAAADPNTPRPFILFLHGAGETGNNNVAQINGNIDNLLDGAKEHGAFLYAPQAVTRNWSDMNRTTTVMDKIDEALAMHNIDPNRLYVTGLSMGGGGVWNMANRFSDRFAAAVPIAGVNPSFDFNGSNFVELPTWPFHARDDGVVPPTPSRDTINNILAAAGEATLTYPAPNDGFTTLLYNNSEFEINYTEFPTGGHGIWGPVYDMPELYDWLLQHELGGPAPTNSTRGVQIVMNNVQLGANGTVAAVLPIADAQGNPIRRGTGFAAVGAFDLPDAEITAANFSTLADLDAAFHQFGASVEFGAGRLSGLFAGNIGGPLNVGDPLAGKNIYVVAGDGPDILGSESLVVFKSDARFNLGIRGRSALSAAVELDMSLAGGELLLGTPATVFVNQLGGNRPGLQGAFVGVPEPATAALLVLATALLAARHQRY